MKNTLKIFSIILSFILTFSLAACETKDLSGKDNNNNSLAQISGTDNDGTDTGSTTGTSDQSFEINDKSFASRISGNYKCMNGDGSYFLLSIYNVMGNLYAFGGESYEEDENEPYSFWAMEIIPEDPADVYDENKDEIRAGVLSFSIMANLGDYFQSPVMGTFKIEDDGITVSGDSASPIGAYGQTVHLTKSKEEFGAFSGDFSDVLEVTKQTHDDELYGIWKQKDTDVPAFIIFEKGKEEDRITIYEKAAGEEVILYGGAYATEGSGNMKIMVSGLHRNDPFRIDTDYEISGNTLKLSNLSDLELILKGNDFEFEKTDINDCPLVGLYEPDNIEAIKGTLTYNGRKICAHFKASDDIENNGTFFVRVGDVVFFRYFEDKTSDEKVYDPFGEFLEDFELRELGCVCYYDLKTKDCGLAFRDCGVGELYYMDGRFYTEHFDANDVSSVRYIQRCYPDGSGLESYTSEDAYSWIIGICDDNSHMAINEFHNGETYICDGSIYSSHMESDHEDMVLGSDFVGDNLYCVFYDYGERLRLKELSSSDANYELGEYPVNTEDDIIYPQVMQISENNGKVYIEIAWYEGDLVHLENVTILEVTPEKSNSVKMIYEGVPENLNEYASPYFYFNADDEIIFEDYDPPIVMLTEETYGDLVFFDSYFGATMIKEQMIPEYPFDEDKEGIPVTIFQCAEKTGNSIFAITAEGIYDSEENFNWQMIYVFDRFDYIIFEPDGNGGYTERSLKPVINR